MLLSYKWLKSFFHENDKTAQDIADILTAQGIEVGSVKYLGDTFVGVVVGEVKECMKHPEADKLSVCTVSDGTTDFQVICGAPNVRSGIKVPFAKIDAVLPNDFQIKKAKLRGVESFGMLCSEKELGFAAESSGIWILPDALVVGTDFREFTEMNDFVMEIEITPNRGDCLSVLGVAREVAAGLNVDLRMPEISYADAAENKLSIKVENKDLCNSYKAVVIDGIKPIETPIWMKARLIKAEIRPISLVVDITNYVMIETGHPMHAFDYEKLKDHKIVVRKAKEEEKILALDGKEYELDFENLIIADAQNPIAIAGVMGGEESSVTESTKTIVFESAVFDPTTVRKTSKKLGLSSDSSYRFERGVSQEISDLAINRAVFLLKQICPSIKILQKVEVKTEASETKIELRASRVSQVIGKKYQKTRIHELLERLNFQMIKKTDDILEVTIPSYRNDITQEIDLIEEIVRLDGVDNIASEPMFISPFFDKAQNDKWNRIHDVKRFFKSLNFHEAINYSFLSAEKIGEDVANCFRIINPLSKEEEYLNISRLPRLIENAVTSFRRNEESIKLFEFGKSYFKNTNDPEKLENNEKYKLAAVVIGNQEELSWQQATKKMDFFYLKGVLETFCGDFLFVENDVFSGGKKIGFIKQLDYEKTDIFVFEIEIDLDAITPAKKYEKLSSFPFVSRDLSLITNKTVKYEDIQKVILEAGGELLKNIKVFDVYEGAPIEQDFRNISVRLYFQSEKKTLEDKTVNFIQDKILDELNEKLCVKLRP